MVAASAPADLIFQHGAETSSRFNAQSSGSLGDGFAPATTQIFTNALFQSDATSAHIDSLTFGIRRLTGAPEVNIRFYAGLMDTNGDLVSSSVLDLGAQTLTALAGSSITQAVTLSNLDLSLALTDLAGSGNPGYVGLWFGLAFEGPNATSNLNGWRITNTPAVGSAFNFFYANDPVGGGSAGYQFAEPTPSYFYLDVNGTLVPAPGAFALLGAAGAIGARRRRS
ncbi:MAG: hypothetical protein U0572_05095 [Phycisphaerales bacterium]